MIIFCNSLFRSGVPQYASCLERLASELLTLPPPHVSDEQLTSMTHVCWSWILQSRLLSVGFKLRSWQGVRMPRISLSQVLFLPSRIVEQASVESPNNWGVKVMSQSRKYFVVLCLLNQASLNTFILPKHNILGVLGWQISRKFQKTKALGTRMMSGSFELRFWKENGRRRLSHHITNGIVPQNGGKCLSGGFVCWKLQL